MGREGKFAVMEFVMSERILGREKEERKEKGEEEG